jgi:hypothetical protein
MQLDSNVLASTAIFRQVQEQPRDWCTTTDVRITFTFSSTALIV